MKKFTYLLLFCSMFSIKNSYCASIIDKGEAKVEKEIDESEEQNMNKTLLGLLNSQYLKVVDEQIEYRNNPEKLKAITERREELGKTIEALRLRISINEPDDIISQKPISTVNTDLMNAILAENLDLKTRLEIIEKALSDGADVNTVNQFNQNVLQVAIEKGAPIDAISIIASRTKDINHRDMFYHTPMYEAVVRGELNIVDLLLNLKASLVLPKSKKKFFKWNILHVIVFAKNGEHGDLLEPIFERMDSKEIERMINEQDANGRTPLHLASVFPRYQVLESLLRRGAYTNIPDKFNRQTPFHHLAQSSCDANMIKLFIEYMGSLSLTDKDGKTPSHYIQGNGYISKETKKEIMSIILKAKIENEKAEAERESKIKKMLKNLKVTIGLKLKKGSNLHLLLA